MTDAELLREITDCGLEDFYQSPSRKGSRELDFGVWWRAGERTFPRWRVSYVLDTGEFYATEGTRVMILGRIPVTEDFQRAEQTLDGWEGRLYGPSGLEWCAQRVAAAQGRAAR